MESLAVILEGDEKELLFHFNGKIDMGCLGMVADIIQAFLNKAIDDPFSVSGGDVCRGAG